MSRALVTTAVAALLVVLTTGTAAPGARTAAVLLVTVPLLVGQSRGWPLVRAGGLVALVLVVGPGATRIGDSRLLLLTVVATWVVVLAVATTAPRTRAGSVAPTGRARLRAALAPTAAIVATIPLVLLVDTTGGVGLRAGWAALAAGVLVLALLVVLRPAPARGDQVSSSR